MNLLFVKITGLETAYIKTIRLFYKGKETVLDQENFIKWVKESS